MKQEDINFLKDLQHELNTQTNDGNADPVFWVVAQHTRTYGMNSDYADDSVLVDINCHEEVANNVDEAKQYIIENELYVTSDDKEELDGCEYMNDIWNLLDQWGYGQDYYICNYTEDYNSIVPDTLFITKRECKNHIRLNDYHYDKPHTYAMTAWRSPEFERFMKLFETMDLDKLESDK